MAELIIALTILAWVVLIVATVWGGIPLVRFILRKSGSRDISATEPEEQVLRGGTWIGIFERLIVFLAIAFHLYTLIAVVVAVKGLGRFPELRAHPSASEKFVIGTLASITWAGLLGGITWLLPAL